MKRFHAAFLAAAAIQILGGKAARAQQPPAPFQTQPAQPPAGTPVGGINLNNASIVEVIDLFARELHMNYVLDAAIKGGSVTVNTFGVVRDVDLRPLFETILRMNNLALVQAGNIYRIVPIVNVGHQPIKPITQTDSTKIDEDERMLLNLVFLRYATAAEMVKVLTPFMGDGGQMTSYDPANLLILLDNGRNMRRTLDLVNMFDSDTFAGQRVRAFDVKHGRPTDVAKELEEVFKAYSLTASKEHGAIQFLPIDRINTILAVAPNPGVFAEVEKWIAKLDITVKVTAGSTQNFVYKLKYQRAEILGAVIMQLYGGCGSMGGYGMGTGSSNYPAQGTVAGMSGGMGGGMGGGMIGGMGGGYGSPYGGGAGGGYGSPYGGGGGGYGAGMGGGMGGSAFGGGGYGSNCIGGYGAGGYGGGTAGFGATTPFTAPAAATGASAPGTKTDQTGTYLAPGATPGPALGAMPPRIVPNPFDNTLVVQTTPDQWEQIKGLLDQLDVSPRQVLIEAKIYEVDLTGAFSAGVQAFLQASGTTNAAVPSHQLNATSSAGSLLLSAGTLVGQSRQLLALLQLQESRTKAKVLSAPSVIATDSIAASITVGDSVPTLTSQAVNAGVTSGGNSLFTQTISNTSTGIGLNILARVNSSGIVTMVINQSVTAPEPNPSGTSINSPSFSQRNVSTQVTVQDGDTIAIGGIINENTTETSSGIPLLDRLPYVGAAFGNKSYSKQRTELVIFLTPRVIYDTNQVAEASQELKDKFKDLKKAIRDQ